MTRTPWVLYFLSKYKNLLIFECHKFSKINNFIFKRLKDKENIILIFTNNNLKNDFTISKKLEKKSIILESSYEESLFSNFRKNKIKRKIVFVGNLLRFDKKRDIDFLIEVFNDEKLKDFNLVIIGGPNDVAEELQKISGENIKFLGFMSNKNAIKEMETAEIGILINEKNRHSEKHTSPIKYFEYLRSGLKILAVNFDSHVKLPINENVLYFEKGHKEDFMKNLFKLDHAEFKNNNEIIKYSYNYRVQRLLKHIARLEGLEPPTL
tara:strand:- start:10 stop:807 length:798 start_codon:yes stop_codon:yes gene_type:complete